MVEVRSPAAFLVLCFFACLSAGAEVDFSGEVLPIFASKCASCHGGVKKTSGFTFTDPETLFSPAESGATPIVRGRPEESELIMRITHSDSDEVMPPKGDPLEQGEIDILRKWIASGADWKQHWAFAPRDPGGLPEINARDWPVNEIDHFVLARLEDVAIRPSPDADRYTLIRRVALDLTGLPPSIAEVDAFVADKSPHAFEKVVDRYQASPHFGERWARHWLDQARYADSDGYEKDKARPDAWVWRQWVIDSINRDQPFDEFTIEQLAGDLLPEATIHQRVATAFHRQTLFNREGGVDAEEDRTKRVIDRATTTATTWLGLTMECAQCHDHPYDPITQREFYEFYAFFNNADEGSLAVGSVYGSQKSTDEKNPQRINARVIQERVNNPRATYVFHRGDFLQPMKNLGEVDRSTPELAHPFDSGDATRLDLARWLVAEENPLTARVVSNMIWSHLFGAGLVPTPGDFGTRGGPPTHPRLLDWLAEEFIRNGWSRKKLIKTIVMSRTYRQASAHRPELAAMDSNNDLLHRQNRPRVEAEIIRDLHLSVSGLLSRKIGGESVFPPIPADVAALSYASSFKWKTSAGPDRHRRGMYTFFKRTAPDPNLMTFDCPDSNLTTTARSTSNTPLMALATMQNEVFHEAAQAFAERVLSQKNLKNDVERLTFAFRTCVARRPVSAEIKTLSDLLDESRAFYRSDRESAVKLAPPKYHDPVEAAAWVATLRILTNLDEFIVRN